MQFNSILSIIICLNNTKNERSLILTILIAIIGYNIKINFICINSIINLLSISKHVVNLINKNQEGFDIKDLSMISFGICKGDK